MKQHRQVHITIEESAATWKHYPAILQHNFLRRYSAQNLKLLPVSSVATSWAGLKFNFSHFSHFDLKLVPFTLKKSYVTHTPKFLCPKMCVLRYFYPTRLVSLSHINISLFSHSFYFAENGPFQTRVLKKSPASDRALSCVQQLGSLKFACGTSPVCNKRPSATDTRIPVEADVAQISRGLNWGCAEFGSNPTGTGGDLAVKREKKPRRINRSEAPEKKGSTDGKSKWRSREKCVRSGFQ